MRVMLYNSDLTKFSNENVPMFSILDSMTSSMARNNIVFTIQICHWRKLLHLEKGAVTQKGM